MREEVVYISVEEGKVTNLKRLHEVIYSFDGNIECVVRKKKKRRSERQNKWWWACMGILSKHTGFTKDECHEICKYKFLKKEKVIEATGEIVEYIGHTSQLTTVEFSECIESVIMWAASTLNCQLPYPLEQTELTLNQ